jgi:hypothetical protein
VPWPGIGSQAQAGESLRLSGLRLALPGTAGRNCHFFKKMKERRKFQKIMNYHKLKILR